MDFDSRYTKWKVYTEIEHEKALTTVSTKEGRKDFFLRVLDEVEYLVLWKLGANSWTQLSKKLLIQ